jgi:signal transduction histidine kinase/CheY-like chemotaxis protein
MFRRKPRVEKLSDWHRVKSRHQRGSTVRATVVRAVGLGLLCRLQGDAKAPGLVRNREISWMKTAQHSVDFTPGDHFEAIVVGYDDLNRQLLLSKKRAGINPVTAFPVGLEIECEIAERLTWGYLVHLRGGVDGELYRKDVPNDEELPHSIRLQHGDRLLLEVIGHDPESQTPVLSLNRTIERHQTAIEAEIRKLDPNRYHLQTVMVAPITRSREPLSILLVDDEPEVLASVAALLMRAGHQVAQASSREESQIWLASSQVLDVVLLDIQLRGESIRSPELPFEILRRHPMARLYLFTGNEELLSQDEAVELDDYIEGLIPKGDSDVLLAIVEGRAQALSFEFLTSNRQAKSSHAIRGANPSEILQAAVKRHLQELTSLWPDTVLLVAEHNRESNIAAPLAGTGFPLDELKKRSQAFLSCELGRVLTDGDVLCLRLRDRLDPEARHWINLVSGGQVIGHPIKIGGYPRNLGIYFFISEIHEVTKDQIEHRLQPRIASLILDIERNVLHHKILTFQKAASTGSLVLGMTHELKNLLLPIDARLVTFLTDVHALAHARETVSPDTLLTAGSRLRDSIKSLTKMMEGFLRMTRGDADKLLPLDVILSEVVALCADSGRQFDVFVSPLTNDVDQAGIPMVPSRVRQVFMNIVLNAIQHCDHTSRIRHKLVTTQIARPFDKRLPGILVKITDNGYGVAASARDQIFDMFYTTRPAGSGLGLYVAKDIIESLGGWIVVEHNSRYRENTLSVFIPDNSPTR